MSFVKVSLEDDECHQKILQRDAILSATLPKTLALSTDTFKVVAGSIFRLLSSLDNIYL